MRLSIIVPCYNSAKNINNILNSLKKQTTPTVEVIFINDGSSDNTAEIISRNIDNESLKNFYLYNYENKGAAKARERGLGKAVGEYIFFLDSDDVISDEFISSVYRAMSNNPDIIYFSSVVVSSESINDKLEDKVAFDKNETYYDCDLFICEMLKNNNWTSAVWTYVFRRDLAIKHNAIFTNRIAHEDHLFSIRLVGNAKKIIIISNVLYFQKRTVGSLTTSEKNSSYILERFKAFEEARDDMKAIYSDNAVKLYEQWSIRSILFLCIENYKNIYPWLLSFKLYRYIWSYRSRIFYILLRYVLTKIKMRFE